MALTRELSMRRGAAGAGTAAAIVAARNERRFMFRLKARLAFGIVELSIHPAALPTLWLTS
jgi:hypothetical protein